MKSCNNRPCRASLFYINGHSYLLQSFHQDNSAKLDLFIWLLMLNSKSLIKDEETRCNRDSHVSLPDRCSDFTLHRDQLIVSISLRSKTDCSSDRNLSVSYAVVKYLFIFITWKAKVHDMTPNFLNNDDGPSIWTGTQFDHNLGRKRKSWKF